VQQKVVIGTCREQAESIQTLLIKILYSQFVKGKGKAIPVTGREGP
jgi:hypothetical protein